MDTISMIGDLRDFDPTQRKKKRKPQQHQTLQEHTTTTTTPSHQEVTKNDNNDDDEKHLTSTTKTVETEGGYDETAVGFCDTYLSMIDRLYDEIVAEQGFDMVTKRRCLQIPNLVRIGSKKIGWLNFGSNCASLNRDVDHVSKFVLAELGTTGALGAENKLVLKGRYRPPQLQIVLKNYIAEYVMCKSCSGVDTILQKENRILFKLCTTCNAKSSVVNISAGFKVQTNRRLEKGI